MESVNNFNRIQDGAWLKSSCVYDLKFRKILDYLCNGKSEMSNVCNAVEGHCLQAMKIVHHHANGRFDWLISEHQSLNPLKDASSTIS